MQNSHFSQLAEKYISEVESAGIVVNIDSVNTEAEPIIGFDKSYCFDIELPHEIRNTSEYDIDDEDSIYDDVCLVLEENSTEVVGFLYNSGSFISSKEFRMNYSSEIIYHNNTEVKGVPVDQFKSYFEQLI